MITIKKTFHLPESYPLWRLGKLEDLLFFDIETTGFSGDYSNLYLIGCIYYRKEKWYLVQWFADQSHSEAELLHAFFSFLSSFSILIHFNGDGFDIPYLLKRCQHYNLPYNFSRIKSIDIYKKIKPYKNLLGLDSLKQKSIECFLGICRTDRYSGGQLIDFYKDYLMSHDDSLYHLLLLHNEEDLKGMPSILPILFYSDFLSEHLVLRKKKVLKKEETTSSSRSYLHLSYESPVSIPITVEREQNGFYFLLSKQQLLLEIPLFKGELKHFYQDYHNYVYLIYEDTAIHKSIGQYVDKSARKKATARTCYTKMQGLFLPQPTPIWNSCLKKDYTDKLSYVLYKPDLFDSQEIADQYRITILEAYFKK